MAVTKSINTNGSKGHHKFTLTVTEGTITSEHIANNVSPVGFSFVLSAVQTGWDWSGWGDKISYTITIGTNTYSGTIPSYNGSSTVTLKSGSNIPIPHNSDGSKTLSISFSVSDSTGVNYTCGNASTSGSLTLTAIPRASTWDNDGIYYYDGFLDNGAVMYFTSHSTSFYHKLKILPWSRVDDQSISLREITNYQSGQQITFTTSELNTMYAASVPQQYIYIYFDLYTYSDNTYTTQIGSKDRCFVRFPLVVSAPTFSNFSYSDTNTTTVNLTKNAATIVKGFSTLTVSISTSQKAVANTRQTQISHYIVDGNTVSYSSSSTVTKSLSNYNKDNISVYAVDTREMSSPVINKSFSALSKYVAYETVFKNDQQSYSRSNGGVGEFVTLTFSGTWWGNKKFGNVSNAVTNSIRATYKYRVSGTSNWVVPASNTLSLTLGKASSSDTYYTKFSYNNTVNGDMPNNGFDVSKSYDIMVTVADVLSSVDYTFSVHSGEPAIALYKNKAALGAKYDQTLGGTQLWGNTYLNGSLLSTTNVDIIYPVGSIYLNVDGTVNPNNIFAGTTWVRIKDTFLLAAGDTYTSGATGGSATVTLTTEQIPSHAHVATTKTTSYGSGSQSDWRCMSFVGTNADYSQTVNTGSTGGGKAHDNMPPYLVINVWKRTA